MTRGNEQVKKVTPTPDQKRKEHKNMPVLYDTASIKGTKYHKEEKITKEKTKNDDAVWIGKNKGGFRMIAIADGVGGSDRGDMMANRIMRNLSDSKGNSSSSAARAMEYAHRDVRSDLGGTAETASATATAGIIDQENRLHIAHAGDTRIYRLHTNTDGTKQVELLTPVQNPREQYIEKLMAKGKTRSEAKKMIDLEFKQKVDEIYGNSAWPASYGDKEARKEAEKIAKDRYPQFKNQPAQFSSTREAPEIYTRTVQLQKEDELFVVTDGVVSGFETNIALERTLEKMSKEHQPADALVKYSKDLQIHKRQRDDITAGYLRIE